MFPKQKNGHLTSTGFDRIADDFFDNIESNSFDSNRFINELNEKEPTAKDSFVLIDKVMENAKKRMKNTNDYKLLHNAQKLVNLLSRAHTPSQQVLDVLFFPSLENEQKLVNYLNEAKLEILLCMFTVSNDNLSSALLAAHHRGVRVKIVTDDFWVSQKGSDVLDLVAEGIEIRTDKVLKDYMHNKFVIIDSRILMTGSYNWTTHASMANQENVVVLENKILVDKFTEHFELLWKQYSQTSVKAKKATKKTILYQKLQKILLKKSAYQKMKSQSFEESAPIRQPPKKIKVSSAILKPSKKIQKLSRPVGSQPHRSEATVKTNTLSSAVEIGLKCIMLTVTAGFFYILTNSRELFA